MMSRACEGVNEDTEMARRAKDCPKTGSPDPTLPPLRRPPGDNSPSGAMAIMLAALAMLAIASFGFIGTEPTEIAKAERALEIRQRATASAPGMAMSPAVKRQAENEVR